MTKARRELAARMTTQDLVVEVLDARLPAASANPLITALRGELPCLKILTRSDLADPAQTAAWVRHLEATGGGAVTAFAATTRQADDTRRRFAEALAQRRLVSTPGKPVRVLVAGIPNVGKSTLLNTLLDRVVAKVGDKPAVTKNQQHVALATGTILTDSPGLLWPKIEDEAVALTLALAGSIPDTAIDHVLVARFGAMRLCERYAALVQARWKLPTLPATGDELVRAIGKRRGCLLPGGIVDEHRAAELLIYEFRDGTLGRITLDVPPT